MKEQIKMKAGYIIKNNVFGFSDSDNCIIVSNYDATNEVTLTSYDKNNIEDIVGSYTIGIWKIKKTNN